MGGSEPRHVSDQFDCSVSGDAPIARSLYFYSVALTFETASMDLSANLSSGMLVSMDIYIDSSRAYRSDHFFPFSSCDPLRDGATHNVDGCN